MTMHKVVIWIVVIWVCKTIQEDTSVPYLIPANIYNIKYIKLINLGSGAFSAPPLAILNIPELLKYSCFINIQTRRYTLGIPVIFWNSSYIDNLNSQRLTVDSSGKNIIKVIPPSNILKFRMNWRRPGIRENEILLDSSWYNADLNYILPMSQTFIMEFEAGNSSEQLCNQIKNDLISIPTQRQELEIIFNIGGVVERKIPEIIIKSDDLCSVDPMVGRCENKNNYYSYRSYANTSIYLTSAKNFSYNVAVNVMKRSGMQNIEVQEKIRKLVYNYICEDQMPYSKVYQNVIGDSVVLNSRTKICRIPSDVINNNATIGVVKSIMTSEKSREFSIPILNSI